MCMSIEWRILRKFDRPFLRNSKGKKCMGSYGSSEKWR